MLRPLNPPLNVLLNLWRALNYKLFFWSEENVKTFFHLGSWREKHQNGNLFTREWKTIKQKAWCKKRKLTMKHYHKNKKQSRFQSTRGLSINICKTLNANILHLNAKIGIWLLWIFISFSFFFFSFFFFLFFFEVS